LHPYRKIHFVGHAASSSRVEVCKLSNWLSYIGRFKVDDGETEGEGIKEEEQSGPMGKR
jgi:hypothetical protein